MIVAIATHPETENVERFGHGFPLLLIDVEGKEVRSTRVLEPQEGCCGTLAKRLEGTDVLICTGVGPGAARHLQALGVSVAVVDEGVPASTALAWAASQSLETGNAKPTGCCGGHHHGDAGHDHQQEPHQGAAGHKCGCGGHGKS